MRPKLFSSVYKRFSCLKYAYQPPTSRQQLTAGFSVFFFVQTKCRFFFNSHFFLYKEGAVACQVLCVESEWDLFCGGGRVTGKEVGQSV